MRWQTNPISMTLRRIGRRLGLNAHLARLLAGNRYEDRFGAAIEGVIRPGDCVWDVGANVGYYSLRFAGLVGERGQVLAFEPSPANRAKLDEAVKGIQAVKVLPLALGDVEAMLPFVQGTDAVGATSHLAYDREDPSRVGEAVRVRTGRGLIENGEAMRPNVIKVDVEGYELDVLSGLGAHLLAPSLRAVCVEVQFAILQGRGLATAPEEIEAMLGRSGFHLSWPDASHIIAERSE